MPFFFLVSGVFANPEKFTFHRYIAKNSKRLLIPYVVFFLIGLLVTICVPGWRDISVYDIMHDFITTPRIVNMNPIWFLTCLFCVTVLFYPLNKLLLAKGNYLIALLILLGLMIASPMITYYCEKCNIFVPMKLDVAFSALPFYSLGFIIKKHILSLDKLNNKIITAAICFIGALSAAYRNGLVAMVNNGYGNDLLIYLYGALCGSVWVLLVGYYLRKSMILRFIGKNSLIIFATHMMCIKFFTLALSKITGEAKIAQNNLNFIQIGIGFALAAMASVFIAYGYQKIIIMIRKRKYHG